MSEPVFRSPGVGRQVISGMEAFSGRVPGPGRIVKIGEAETLGAYSVYESTLEADTPGPRPHVHPLAEEAWYVIEGTLKFQIGEQELIGGPGAFVIVPRGSLHSFSNAGADTAKYLMIFSPARDVLWETVTAMREAAGDSPLDIAKLRALYVEHGENPPSPSRV